MKLIKFLAVTVVILGVTACNNDPSLQEYFVNNQEDNEFLALDVPTSMFANMKAMDDSQQETLKSIKKINVLAFKAEENPVKFEDEKSKLDKIFKDKKYQLLMKYGGDDKKAEVYFIGEDDAIDELIVYGYDDKKGMGIARVLGEDMNPQKIMELMKSLEKGDVNIDGLKDLTGIFREKDTVKSDKIENNTVLKDSIKEDSIKEDTLK